MQRWGRALGLKYDEARGEGRNLRIGSPQKETLPPGPTAGRPMGRTLGETGTRPRVAVGFHGSLRRSQPLRLPTRISRNLFMGWYH